MNESAIYLIVIKGWSIDETREYLRFNYPNATCSAIEDALNFATKDKNPYPLHVDFDNWKEP